MQGVSKLNSTLLKTVALLTLAATTAASAQSSGFQLPRDYFDRFGSTTLTVSNETGYGVQYFPLPFEPDIRLSLVREPKYWIYNVSLRRNDTTFAFGVFDNGYTAPSGIPKLEVTHDPYKGLQFSAVVQHLDPILPVKSYDPFTKFTAGYAFTVWNDRIRILNNVGVGYKSITDDTTYAVTQDIFAPYTESIIGGGYGQPIGDKMSVRLYATGRLYTFPLQGQYQASIDLSPGFETHPIPGLSLDLSHLERFATGSVPIGDLNLARYEESYATLSYRLPGNPEFGVGMLRSRLTKNWIGNSGNTYLRNDVLFSVKALPALVGPSVGYLWSPNGNSWLLSLAFAPK